MPYPLFLKGRSLDKLNPDEVYVLAAILPKATLQNHYRFYKGVLEEALQKRHFEPNVSKEALALLRQKLQLKDEEHDRILAEIIREKPNLTAR